MKVKVNPPLDDRTREWVKVEKNMTAAKNLVDMLSDVKNNGGKKLSEFDIYLLLTEHLIESGKSGFVLTERGNRMLEAGNLIVSNPPKALNTVGVLPPDGDNMTVEKPKHKNTSEAGKTNPAGVKVMMSKARQMYKKYRTDMLRVVHRPNPFGQTSTLFAFFDDGHVEFITHATPARTYYRGKEPFFEFEVAWHPFMSYRDLDDIFEYHLNDYSNYLEEEKEREQERDENLKAYEEWAKATREEYEKWK